MSDEQPDLETQLLVHSRSSTMQSLWARAAQIRPVCGCPQCAGHTVARRSTASATRRAPRYLTSSTLWYSGIFASAATYDAARKDRRREHWNQAISDVKRDIELLGARQDADIATNPETSSLESSVIESQDRRPDASLDPNDALACASHSTEVEREGPHAIDEMTPMTSSLPTPSSSTNAAKQTDADPISVNPNDPHDNYGDWVKDQVDGEVQSVAGQGNARGPQGRRPHTWPVSTGRALTEYELPPHSIYAASWRRAMAEIAPLSEKKIETIQLSMDMFLLYLLRRLHLLRASTEASLTVPYGFGLLIRKSAEEQAVMLQQKKEDLARLRFSYGNNISGWSRSQEDIPLCHYDETGSLQSRAITHELNSTLQSLFRRYAQGEISKPVALARIAYNLAISSAPPNTDTYNVLLIEFARAEESALVRAVIRSLRQTHMRPNEITLSTLLRFHTSIGDAPNFQRWIALTRGQLSGLMLARPDLGVSGTSERLIRRVGNHEDKLVELANPSPLVMQAIVEGVLRFSGFEAALNVCRGLGQAGWGLDLRGMTALINDCTIRSDWTSGLAVWEQMLSLKEKGNHQHRNTSRPYQFELRTFVALLKLCAQCNQRERFIETLAETLQAYRRSRKQILELIQNSSPVSPSTEQVLSEDKSSGMNDNGNKQQMQQFLEQIFGDEYTAGPSRKPIVKAPRTRRKTVKKANVDFFGNLFTENPWISMLR